jgi:hypothetical protein
MLVVSALRLQVDEGRVAGALRSACAALVAKNNAMFRAAGVAVWETRFRVPGGAWRLLTYCPTGRQRQNGAHALIPRISMREQDNKHSSRGDTDHNTAVLRLAVRILLPAGHEAGEEHVEVYREQLGPDGKTLMYRLPAEGGATPGTPASQDGKSILEPYAGLEVRTPQPSA